MAYDYQRESLKNAGLSDEYIDKLLGKKDTTVYTQDIPRKIMGDSQLADRLLGPKTKKKKTKPSVTYDYQRASLKNAGLSDEYINKILNENKQIKQVAEKKQDVLRSQASVYAQKTEQALREGAIQEPTPTPQATPTPYPTSYPTPYPTSQTEKDKPPIVAPPSMGDLSDYQRTPRIEEPEPQYDEEWIRQRQQYLEDIGWAETSKALEKTTPEQTLEHLKQMEGYREGAKIEHYTPEWKQQNPELAFQIEQQEFKNNLKALYYGVGTGIGAEATDIFVNAPYRALTGEPLVDSDTEKSLRHYLGYGPEKGGETVELAQSAERFGRAGVDIGVMIATKNPLVGGFLVGASSTFGKDATPIESLKAGVSTALFMLFGSKASQMTAQQISKKLAETNLKNTTLGTIIEKVMSGSAFGAGGTVSQELISDWTGHKPTAEEYAHNMLLGVMFEAIPATFFSLQRGMIRENVHNQANYYHNIFFNKYKELSKLKTLEEKMAHYDDMINTAKEYQKFVKNQKLAGGKEHLEYFEKMIDNTIQLMRKERGIIAIKQDLKKEHPSYKETKAEPKAEPKPEVKEPIPLPEAREIKEVAPKVEVAPKEVAPKVEVAPKEVSPKITRPITQQVSEKIADKTVDKIDVAVEPTQVEKIKEVATPGEEPKLIDMIKNDTNIKELMDKGLKSNAIRQMQNKYQIDRKTANKIYAELKPAEVVKPKKVSKPDKLGFTSPQGTEKYMQPESTGEGKIEKATTPQQLVDKIANNYPDAVVRKGRTGKRALGDFERRTFVIRLRKSNDIPTLTHELAHYLDISNDITSKMSDATKNKLSQKFTQSQTDKMKLDTKAKESFAEIIRSYIVGEIKIDDPYYQDYVVKNLKKDDLKFIDELRDDITNIINLKPVDSVINTVSSTGAKVGKQLTVTEQFNKVYMDWVDENYFLIKTGRELAGETGRETIEGSVAQYRGFGSTVKYNLNPNLDKGHFQTDVNDNNIGPSLGDIIKPVLKKGNKTINKFFRGYLVSKRAKDYKAKGLEMPLAYETYEKALKELEATNPEFKEVAEQLKTFKENQMQMLVDTGLMTQEAVDKIIENNPNHTYLFRIRKPNSRTGKYVKGNVIKKVVGSGLDIVDPFESIIKMSYVYWSLARRQQIVSQLAEYAKTAKGKGKFIHKADAKYQPTKLNPKRVAEVVKTYFNVVFEQLGMKEAELEELAKQIDETSELQAIGQILFDISYKTGENQIVVHEKGKPVLYNVHPLLYRTLVDLQPSFRTPLTDWILKGFDLQAKTVMANVPFAIKLGIREALSDLIYTRTGLTPLDILKGYINVIGGNAVWKEYEKRGGINEVYFSQGGVFEREVIKQFKASVDKYKKSAYYASRPFDTIMDLLVMFDAGPKMAETMRDLENQGYFKQSLLDTIIEATQNRLNMVPNKFWETQAKLNNVPTEVFKRAIFKGRDISYDPSKKGRLMRQYQLNRVWRFSNSNFQGNTIMPRKMLIPRKTSRSKSTLKNLVALNLFDNNVSNAWLRATAVIMFSVGLYALNRKNKTYQELEDWVTDLFWPIPVTYGDDVTVDNTEYYYFLPKSFQDHFLFATIPERVMRQMEDDEYIDKRAWEGIMDSAGAIFLPEGMPMGLSPLMENWTNRQWNGLPVETFADKQLQPVDRYNENTSMLARTMAEYTKDMDFLPESLKSPKMIDNLIIGYTNAIGKSTLAVIDVFFDKKKPKDILTTSGALNLIGVRDASRYSKSISEFYRDWEKATQLLNSAKKRDPELKNLNESERRMMGILLTNMYTNIGESMDALTDARETALNAGDKELAKELFESKKELAKFANELEDLFYSDDMEGE